MTNEWGETVDELLIEMDAKLEDLSELEAELASEIEERQDNGRQTIGKEVLLKHVQAERQNLEAEAEELRETRQQTPLLRLSDEQMEQFVSQFFPGAVGEIYDE